MLQWGRGHVTAEWRRHSAMLHAATGLLQWGRGHVTAEWVAAKAAAISQSIASMGPRSRDRGVNTAELAPFAMRHVLQWGRGHVTAEWTCATG